MTRKKRPDFRKITSGVIPWSFEGLTEACEFDKQLQATPKDDWDLGDMPRFLFEDQETGDPKLFGFNKFALVNQVARHFFRKYPDAEVAAAHLCRFMYIGDFLNWNRQRLIEEGWAEMKGEQFGVDSRIYAALCELPFTGMVNEGGHGCAHFCYDHVIQRARAVPDEKEGKD